MPIVIKRKAKAPAPEPIVKPAPKPDARLQDGPCRAACASSDNMLVPWWLMASYTYYHHDISLLSDELYDKMSRELSEKWDSISHMHKHLITLDDLRAGSLYALPEDRYPLMTRYAAAHLVNTSGLGRIDVRQLR